MKGKGKQDKKEWDNGILRDISTVFAAVLMTAVFLTGCAGEGDQAGETQLPRMEDRESVETVPEGDSLYQGTYRSCILQEDEENFYLCGAYRIARINKETGVLDILWENACAEERGAFVYSVGSGLLLEDRIYFVERQEDAVDSERRFLSCIFTDGTGYERVEELGYGSDSMLLQDGTLYLDDTDKEVWYQVHEDGTLSDRDVLIAENADQTYYNDNGERVFFKREDLADYNSRYVVKVDNCDLKFVDRQTGEEKILAGLDGSYEVVSMDGDTVYVRKLEYTESTANASLAEAAIPMVFEKISIESGERTELFRENLVYSIMDPVIQVGYLYYIEERDYQFYLVRRDLSRSGEAQIIGPALYDTGIGVIGSKEAEQRTIYSENYPDKAVYEISMSWPVVDDRYAGADKINACLEEHRNANLAYVEENLDWIEDLKPDEMGVPSSLSSSFEGYTYFDSRYISFYLAEYDYMSGAAHGMPYWVDYTFDLETGEKLALSDVVGNSEEEVKEIVTRYFAEMIDLSPESYWPDAKEAVYEWTNLESPFYLTKQGITFYFGPYDLACYAAGFQEVTIPYEEFDRKITLEFLH